MLQAEKLQENIKTVEDVRRLMRGCRHKDESTTDENNDSNFHSHLNQQQIFSYRGDLEKLPRPVGVIDTKIFLSDFGGFETFEATSGPACSKAAGSFDWSNSFPNISHIGQPPIFEFDSVTPVWVWV